MTVLLTLRGVTVSFGTPAPLLDRIDLRISRGERVGLLGRNGAGKTTLLRTLAGRVVPDEGDLVWAEQGATIGWLEQDAAVEKTGSVVQVVAEGLSEAAQLIAEYEEVAGSATTPDSGGRGEERQLARLEELQQLIEAAGAWDQERRVDTVLTRLGIDRSASYGELSGGMRRRVLLARALVRSPDLLLLDEPTNHLDIEAIDWLEEFLIAQTSAEGLAVVFVTHDRRFLERVATRIVEVDRGTVRDWGGDYRQFLERREHQRQVDAEQHKKFDQKLAGEEAWIRQGIKARRTRNEGRVRALEKLREERRARRALQGAGSFAIEAGERSGKLVIEAQGVSFSYGEEAPLIAHCDTLVMRGDKVGILGPNGSGKTTLLRLLLGELEPTAGSIRRGTRLEVAFFDQHRAALDEERSVADNVSGGAEKVVVGGRPRHVISYLQDFLFAPERARSPLSSLSGGERARLLLAKLFLRSFNLLVLDEPTNDLDLETLELLESLLVDFDGTVLLVSHDRQFLDNVVTSTLVLEGSGRVTECAGGYSDAQRQLAARDESAAAPRSTSPKRQPEAPPAKAKRDARRKLTYRENEELVGLPARIEALEAEHSELTARFADPALYRSQGEEVAALRQRTSEVEAELAQSYARWEELEALQ